MVSVCVLTLVQCADKGYQGSISRRTVSVCVSLDQCDDIAGECFLADCQCFCVFTLDQSVC